jgi:hypothetical protein
MVLNTSSHDIEVNIKLLVILASGETCAAVVYVLS